MSTTFLPNKGKSRQGSKAGRAPQSSNPGPKAKATGAGGREPADMPAGKKGVSAKRPRARKRTAMKMLRAERAALKTAAGAKLAAGAQLLTKAVSSYAGQIDQSQGRGALRFYDFQEAYSSLVNAVPKGNRLALLRQMRRDIEEVAKAELNVAPAELATSEGGKVTSESFMAGLRRQEQEQREKDIASKQLLPGVEMRARLGVSPQALSAALKAKRMFVMQGPSGEYCYPAFFADDAYDRPVLEKVCKSLGDLPAGSKWDFFMSPRTSLGGKSPLDALAKGKLEAVMAAAQAFAEE